jgi:hypothetical protein
MMSQSTPIIARAAGDRFLRVLAVLGLILGCGLALGACSKCDVPTWQPSQPPSPQ